MTAVPPVPRVLAFTNPYVETHPIGRIWVAVGLTAGVLELFGAFRRRAEATRKDRGSRVVMRICVIPAVILLVLSPRIAPGAEIRPPLARWPGKAPHRNGPRYSGTSRSRSTATRWALLRKTH